MARLQVHESALVEGGSATTPRGFAAGAVAAGVKTIGDPRLDVGILASERACAVAAMFTKSTVKGAAVVVSERHVADGQAQALVVNSGISNVAMGAQGMRDAEEMCALTAAKLRLQPGDVIVGSTGVIGRPLPMDRIRDGIARVGLRSDGGHDFARAILTTDTHAKTLALRFAVGDHEYAIGAVAKGSGMIHPDMATMFCFLTTDAPVERAFLREALQRAVDDSLNMISVDGDTSTSDTAAIFANGAGGGPTIGISDACAASFEDALRGVCVVTGRMLARDGEGATKLITARVGGAASREDARTAARTITASPLVKTAVHGNDPNWGRVLMAVGRSRARIELDAARVWVGDTMVYDRAPVPFDDRGVAEYLRAADGRPDEEVVLRVDLGAGEQAATAWGCDMSPEYVHINADYTT